MSKQITHIRMEPMVGGLLGQVSGGLESISHFLTADGMIYTKAEAVALADQYPDAFYTLGAGAGGLLNALTRHMHTKVEPVHPLGRMPYLRTNPNNESDDNLLSLPRF